MIDILKQTLEKKYKLRDTKWLFVSGFDAQWKTLFSTGLVETDRTLEDVITELYKKNIEPVQWIKILTLDVVTTVYEETNITKIPTTSPKLYGFALVDDKGNTWVLLPGTVWVADAKHALYLIKEKYGIQWKVKIYVFTTDRLLVTL
jgi:hypothetical protein